MKKSVKVDRIDAEIQRELSMILSYGVRDPRLAEAMFSISRVKATKDLKYAKVYISIMTSGDKKAVLKVLQSSAGFMRSQLSEKLRIRTVPELVFELDESFEYGMKIEKLIRDLNKPTEEAAEGSDDSEDKKD